MGRSRYHLFISGKVQGVGFRFRTKIKAKKLGLVGWVKNLDDGRVEIVAEGEEEKLNELVDWVKSSPFLSKVEEVKLLKEEPRNEFDNFTILYS